MHLTDVSNNVKKEIHLCEECSKGQGATIESHMYKQPAYPDLLTQFVEAQSDEPEESGGAEAECPHCGITYKKFRSSGKFGCPHDYAVFKKGLVGLLEKIHGQSQHSGKIPVRASDQIAKQRQLRTLRRDLEKAIRSEAYERAAEIRDQIYQIEGRQQD